MVNAVVVLREILKLQMKTIHFTSFPGPRHPYLVVRGSDSDSFIVPITNPANFLPCFNAVVRWGTWASVLCNFLNQTICQKLHPLILNDKKRSLQDVEEVLYNVRVEIRNSCRNFWNRNLRNFFISSKKTTVWSECRSKAFLFLDVKKTRNFKTNYFWGLHSV